MRRVTNREMAKCVTQREEFDNCIQSCYARWGSAVQMTYNQEGDTVLTPSTEGVYSVVSYGVHLPLYVYSELTNKWYGNEDKYSQLTTNRHAQLARPYGVEITWVSTETMKALLDRGVVGLIQKKFREASGSAGRKAA